MAVAENGVASGAQHLETTDLDRSNSNAVNNNENEKIKDQVFNNLKPQSLHDNHEDNNNNDNDVDDDHHDQHHHDDDDDDEDEGLSKKGGVVVVDDDNLKGEGLKKEIRDLEEMLSKLNPMAKEFVPPSLVSHRSIANINTNVTNNNNNFGLVNNFPIQPIAPGNVNGFPARRRRNGYGQGKRRMNTRTSMAQREEVIRRTVYVSDIDQQVTEEQLAALFINCGQVVDCRVCGDPNSILRFAFIEFTDEEGAKNALTLSGTMLGYYPVRVLPSKTAIAPVNPTFLPKSEDEREMCARTVYCTNIDKKVTQGEIKLFFETFCGEVHRLRLLGDYHHSTRIAFVEFVMAESAIHALNCSGAVMGSLPIRVSPSKTPVRPRPPRSPLH